MNKIILNLKSYISRLNMTPGSYFPGRRVSDFQESPYKRIWVNILLFAVTFITTTFAGTQSLDSVKEFILTGLPYSITIMLILFSHEMGHYLAARKFGVSATLPFFIPFPISIVGTMGAVIKIKSRIPDKRALLYIGAMGPLAGFCVSLIACVVGIYLPEKKFLIMGDDSIFALFGHPFLYVDLSKIIHAPIPVEQYISHHPIIFASWFGFLITGLNLMPIGQLDGGHILHALIGRKQLWFGWIMFIVLIVFSILWPGWILWIILSLTLPKIGHPNIADNEPLRLKEKIIGWACILIFILVFIPKPVDFF